MSRMARRRGARDSASAKPAPASTNGTSAEAAAPAEPTVRRIDSKPAEPVDLLDAAGGSVMRRVGPAVGAVLFLLWVFRRRRKKKAARSS